MLKAQDYHLSEPEFQAIEKALRHDKRPEVCRRCSVLRLLHLGHKPAEVAQMQAISKVTVYEIVHRYKAGGIEGLADRPRSGRPRKWDDEYSRALEAVLDTDPQELGYDFTVWSVNRLRLHLEKETGKALSEPRLRALLKAKGYRYRRPKQDLSHLQDKEAKAQAEELLEALKKRSQETISSFSLWTKRP